jgi:hypothetical protein
MKTRENKKATSFKLQATSCKILLVACGLQLEAFLHPASLFLCLFLIYLA